MNGISTASGELSARGQLWPTHYTLLDQFRGIAALMVVSCHCGYLSWGHWGVTLFFVISGYCILASAHSSMKRGGPRDFAKRRFIRIYPTYLLALGFFIFTRLLKRWMTGDDQLAQYNTLDFIQNATLTQWLSMLVGEEPPFMVTSFWTLNYEVQFYAVVGLCLLAAARLGRPSVNLAVVLITLASLLWVGFSGQDRLGLFVDFWAVFGIGCLVYLRLCVLEERRSRIAVDGCLLVVLLHGIGSHLSELRSFSLFGHLTDDLMVGSGFGILLILLRGMNAWFAATLIGRGLSFLGLVSYSLYLIHQFNLVLVAAAVRLVMPAYSPQFLTIAATLLTHVALATAFWFFCERPFLSGRLPSWRGTKWGNGLKFSKQEDPA